MADHRQRGSRRRLRLMLLTYCDYHLLGDLTGPSVAIRLSSLRLDFHFRSRRRRVILLRWVSSCSFVHSTRNLLLGYVQNCLTEHHQILHGHPHRHNLWPHRIYTDGFGLNLSRTVQARMTEFYTFLGNNQHHKCAGYNITSSFQSVVKCNKILYKSAQNMSGRT